MNILKNKTQNKKKIIKTSWLKSKKTLFSRTNVALRTSVLKRSFSSFRNKNRNLFHFYFYFEEVSKNRRQSDLLYFWDKLEILSIDSLTDFSDKKITITHNIWNIQIASFLSIQRKLHGIHSVSFNLVTIFSLFKQYI